MEIWKLFCFAQKHIPPPDTIFDLQICMYLYVHKRYTHQTNGLIILEIRLPFGENVCDVFFLLYHNQEKRRKTNVLIRFTQEK